MLRATISPGRATNNIKKEIVAAISSLSLSLSKFTEAPLIRFRAREIRGESGESGNEEMWARN